MPTPPKNFNPHPFTYHQEVELVIDDITNLGFGVGRVHLANPTPCPLPEGGEDKGTSPLSNSCLCGSQGVAPQKSPPGFVREGVGGGSWVVMVPFVDIGERVRVRIWRNHATYSEADLVEVLQPSPNRVIAGCPLFGQCGGCQYQHLSYTHQLSLKSTQLRQIYRRLAGIDVEPLPTVASSKEYGYRSKLTPHYKPVRKGMPADTHWPIGFLSATNRNLVDVPRCPIATDAINATLPGLRNSLQAQKDKFKLDGTALLREDASHNVITNHKAVCVQEINGIRYEFIAGEFFQVNTSILPVLAKTVIDALRGQYLIDAYCGVGFFALQAKRCKEVVGVEVSAISIDFARKNAAANNISNAQFLAAKAEAIFDSVKFPPSETSVIIDPPRAGCDERFLRQLIALGPTRVIYVACDAATQARDVKFLIENGYHLTSLQAFDLFPQTRHIESLAILDK